MTISGPTIPFHIARAYGVTPPASMRPAAPIERAQPNTSVEPRRPDHAPSKAERLVAAVVPGRIDFSNDEPQPTGAILPLYRHPADLNAAATNVFAGRMLDVSG